MMNYISLFSGVGGFDLGFDRAGMRCIYQVESDPHCLNVLRRHWPDVPKHDDVTTFGRSVFDGTVALVCGGFPCQDVSVAGKRAGLAGERSGLWWEFARILAELAPTWVCIENVPGLLSSHGGRDMGAVLWTLGQLGYGWAYRVLDAQWFGVAQRRRRVFIVGHSGGRTDRAAQVLFESDCLPWDSAPSRETGQATAGTLGASASGGFRCDLDGHGAYVAPALRANGVGTQRIGNSRGQDCIVFDERNITSVVNRSNPQPGDPCHTLHHDPPRLVLAFAERARHEGRTLEYQEELAYALANPGSGGRTHSRQIATSSGVRRLTPVECERLQGFPDGWTAGQADTHRYRQLGNAVCVPVAEWIGRRMILCCEE